jgi:hypothetical protein
MGVRSCFRLAVLTANHPLCQQHLGSESTKEASDASERKIPILPKASGHNLDRTKTAD